MIPKKLTFQQQLQKINSLLLQFEQEQDPQQKGLKLWELHQNFQQILCVVENESSIVDQRTQQSRMKLKQVNFENLENEYLKETQMIFYEIQINKFASTVKPYYTAKGNQEEMNQCYSRFYKNEKSYEELKNMVLNNKLNSKKQQILDLIKAEIQRFQSVFQKELYEFKEQKNTELSSQQQTPKNEKRVEKRCKFSRSILQDFRATQNVENAKERIIQLKQMKQEQNEQLNQKLIQLKEEEEKPEIDNLKECIQTLIKDMKEIDNTMDENKILIQEEQYNIDDEIVNSNENKCQDVVAEQVLEKTSRRQKRKAVKQALFQLFAFGAAVGISIGEAIQKAITSIQPNKTVEIGDNCDESNNSQQ